MALELKVPAAGESVATVEIGDWQKKVGDVLKQDEIVVILETDKAAMEVPSPVPGTLSQILKQKGETAAPGDVIAIIAEAGEQVAPTPAPPTPEAVTPAPAAPPAPAPQPKAEEKAAPPAPAPQAEEPRVMPSAKRELTERGMRPEEVTPSGPGGRVLKEDVLGPSAIERPATPTAPPAPPVEEKREAPAPPAPPAPAAEAAPGREEEVVPMSLLRRRVAERLVQAQQTQALLTTFNEADMTEVMALRKQYRDQFQERHGIKLGLMSFFVKAAIEALKEFPQPNAEIRGEDIVYRNYYDIGIAVSSQRGLVVPVLRSAERMSFAEIERAIDDFGRRAQENKLKLEELQGGTFTITNGGVFGSLLSTPIINPPQSGILGMHTIQERPVVREGQIVARSMMYLALTYDHRIVDGREAVLFLRRIKECIETPERMLLEF